jgi:hypothetical protein
MVSCFSRNEGTPCGVLSRLPFAGNPTPDDWINSVYYGRLSCQVVFHAESRGQPKARHDKMVGPVETMLKLHRDLPKARTPHVWADSSRPTADGRKMAESER